MPISSDSSSDRDCAGVHDVVTQVCSHILRGDNRLNDAPVRPVTDTIVAGRSGVDGTFVCLYRRLPNANIRMLQAVHDSGAGVPDRYEHGFNATGPTGLITATTAFPIAGNLGHVPRYFRHGGWVVHIEAPRERFSRSPLGDRRGISSFHGPGLGPGHRHTPPLARGGRPWPHHQHRAAGPTSRGTDDDVPLRRCHGTRAPENIPHRYISVTTYASVIRRAPRAPRALGPAGITARSNPVGPALADRSARR
jgi:hypothetical protein